MKIVNLWALIVLIILILVKEWCIIVKCKTKIVLSKIIVDPCNSNALEDFKESLLGNNALQFWLVKKLVWDSIRTLLAPQKLTCVKTRYRIKAHPRNASFQGSYLYHLVPCRLTALYLQKTRDWIQSAQLWTSSCIVHFINE